MTLTGIKKKKKIFPTVKFQPTQNGKIRKISITLGGLTKANSGIPSAVVLMLSDPQQLLLKTKRTNKKPNSCLSSSKMLLYCICLKFQPVTKAKENRHKF